MYSISIFYTQISHPVCQVRDLLRGDPDTDVKIIFDREESSYFIKKQQALASKNTAVTADAR